MEHVGSDLPVSHGGVWLDQCRLQSPLQLGTHHLPHRHSYLRMAHGCQRYPRVQRSHCLVAFEMTGHGLFNSLLRLTTEKTLQLRITVLCGWNPMVTMDSPHKGPIMQRAFLWYDVTMWYLAGMRWATLITSAFIAAGAGIRCIPTNNTTVATWWDENTAPGHMT